MKECFRTWVLAHEKLYRLIVFVLALVAFLAVTAHGCKTMKAEAATDVPMDLINYAISLNRSIDNIVILQDSGGNYYTMVENLRDDVAYLNGNFIVTSYNDCSPILVTPNWWSHKLYRITVNRTFEEVSFSHGSCTGIHFFEHGLQFVYSSKPVLAMGGTDSDGDGIYFQNVTVNEPKYLVNAPFFSHVSTEVQNPILLKYAALSRMYTEIQFKLMGQPMTPAGGYEAEFFVDVYLPSMDFLHDMVYLYVYDENTSSSLHGSSYSEFQYKLNESYQKWWLNVSRGKESYKKFTLRFTQTYDHPIDGNVLLNLPHDYLLECIETGYGSVEDMYLGSITSDKHIYDFCYPTLLKFLTVGQVGNIVHTYNYPDVYYGRYTTITYKANLSEPVITEYNDDYFATGGSDSVDKVVQEEINNAYNDVADKLQSDNQALQDMLDAYYRGENAFSDYNSSDVWSFLSDTTKGLVSVLPSLSGLAAVVGVVFGFLPIQISGMIMTLFVICIFTAIIRFIRG